MNFKLSAACGCNIGIVRKNNEDNFFLNGKTLDVTNQGLKAVTTAKHLSDSKKCFAVFDGMGGEEAGEAASFAAANALKAFLNERSDEHEGLDNCLQAACQVMNEAVCKEMDKLSFGRMGTTAAILLFSNDVVYSCNLGDSRIYRLRNDNLEQLSVDDVEILPDNLKQNRKAPLTQYVGIYPDELMLEPHTTKETIQRDDIYLICSDGLTDMVTDDEIQNCLNQHISVKQSTEHLIRLAIQNGGKDNITVILIRVI